MAMQLIYIIQVYHGDVKNEVCNNYNAFTKAFKSVIVCKQNLAHNKKYDKFYEFWNFYNI